MENLKSQFKIPCKSSHGTAELQMQTQIICLKRATNLGNFFVYLYSRVLKKIGFSLRFSFAKQPKISISHTLIFLN